LNIHTEGVGVTLDVYLQWIKQFFQNGVGHHWISEFHATESLSSNVLPLRVQVKKDTNSKSSYCSVAFDRSVKLSVVAFESYAVTKAV
jgi:hypothetical protein